MSQKKAEQAVKSVADTEGIQLVVQAAYLMDVDEAESLSDRRIGAFRTENPARIFAGA